MISSKIHVANKKAIQASTKLCNKPICNPHWPYNPMQLSSMYQYKLGYKYIDTKYRPSVAEKGNSNLK